MQRNIHIEIPLSDIKQFIALTGINIDLFNRIIQHFRNAEQEIANENYEVRLKHSRMFTRKPSKTREQGMLVTTEVKLYFILYYYKNYPIQEAMANKFNMTVSSANRNIHKYSNVLKRALSTLGALPVHDIRTPSELKQLLENNGVLSIDVTERPINRHSNNEAQKNNYSGKKHQHTNKNLVISTGVRYVLYLGPTTPGTHHDYRMLKDEFPPKEDIFENKEINVDLGFKGIEKDYKTKKTNIPHKKHKKSDKNKNPILTYRQKKENRKFAKVRIVIEHAIGGIKIMNILKIKFRNWVIGFIDEVMVVATGLWNLKLST